MIVHFLSFKEIFDKISRKRTSAWLGRIIFVMLLVNVSCFVYSVKQKNFSYPPEINL